jgi:translation initiation factor 1
MGKRDPPPPRPAAATPFNSPFAKLAARRGEVAADQPRAEPAPPPKASVEPLPARAVVRLERKGRGGKEVTVIEKLELPPRALGAWADELKRSLGCGGVVEGAAIVVQGDQRDRVRRWLEVRGVAKVIAG